MANPVVTFTMADGKVMKAELYPEVALYQSGKKGIL